ncbi:kunitz-type trypsin inhibitor alpha chain-like [Silene latifolia]|uniref:kunitz-type trypsin inhibitor alpha chain-like n=1 Tax=Silene latifolia TaxID=37657 RepID=UPI003D785408
MSSFIFSTSITLVLLSIILPLSTAYLVDIEGDPILNGRLYYIIPTTTKSGLTYTPKDKECPLYITVAKTENSPGTPVIFSSPIQSRKISLDQPLSLSFRGPPPCGSSLIWRESLDPLARKVYITTDGGEIGALPNAPFSIHKTDKSLIPMYELLSTPPGGITSYVGLYEDDGLLGITENPTMVYFKKAFNVLGLSTS